jgi:hypothetical protein
MIKATLHLDTIKSNTYHCLELEQNWRSIPSINVWLKVRGFNLSNPVMVTANISDNSLTFFQSASNSPKNIVLVHPNSQVLQDLYTSLRDAGHTVHAFTKVEKANQHIQSMIDNNQTLNKIVVPRNLEVGYNFTYKQFLQKTFPKYQVLTIDKRRYRDTINLKLNKEQYIQSIMGE